MWASSSSNGLMPLQKDSQMTKKSRDVSCWPKNVRLKLGNVPPEKCSKRKKNKRIKRKRGGQRDEKWYSLKTLTGKSLTSCGPRSKARQICAHRETGNILESRSSMKTGHNTGMESGRFLQKRHIYKVPNRSLSPLYRLQWKSQ